MDASELRERQKPLKERYRDDPEAARVPARALGQIDQGDVAPAM